VLENNIREEITKISEADLQRVFQNVFSRYNACLLANGEHFQHLLLNGKVLSCTCHSGSGAGEHAWLHRQSEKYKIVSKQNASPVVSRIPQAQTGADGRQPTAVLQAGWEGLISTLFAWGAEY